MNEEPTTETKQEPVQLKITNMMSIVEEPAQLNVAGMVSMPDGQSGIDAAEGPEEILIDLAFTEKSKDSDDAASNIIKHIPQSLALGIEVNSDKSV